jgi:hypothetical protein
MSESGESHVSLFLAVTRTDLEPSPLSVIKRWMVFRVDAYSNFIH